MPADAISLLAKKDGPAIQMDPKDHKGTSSNGQRAGSAEYRDTIQEMIDSGDWRKAMAIEIKDARRVAKEAGEPQKYNEAINEMLVYFNCLEKHNLLP